MNKDQRPMNANFQRHGYWERYWWNGVLYRKCVFINGKLNGFDEQYWVNDGKVTNKRYHL